MRISDIRMVNKYILNSRLSSSEKMIMLIVNIFSDGGRDRIDEQFIAERAGLSNSVAEMLVCDLITKGNLTFVAVQKKGSAYNHHSLTASFLSSIC
jgi:hypothetical protein